MERTHPGVLSNYTCSAVLHTWDCMPRVVTVTVSPDTATQFGSWQHLALQFQQLGSSHAFFCNSNVTNCSGWGAWAASVLCQQRVRTQAQALKWAWTRCHSELRETFLIFMGVWIVCHTRYALSIDLLAYFITKKKKVQKKLILKKTNRKCPLLKLMAHASFFLPFWEDFKLLNLFNCLQQWGSPSSEAAGDMMHLPVEHLEVTQGTQPFT